MANTELDLSYLREMAEGDEDFVAEVLSIYLDSAPSLVDDIRTAYINRNAVALTHAAHTLKGSSRSIGAEPFASICEQIEYAARKEQLASCERAVQSLHESYQRLSQEIGLLFLDRAA